MLPQHVWGCFWAAMLWKAKQHRSLIVPKRSRAAVESPSQLWVLFCSGQPWQSKDEGLRRKQVVCIGWESPDSIRMAVMCSVVLAVRIRFVLMRLRLSDQTQMQNCSEICSHELCPAAGWITGSCFPGDEQRAESPHGPVRCYGWVCLETLCEDFLFIPALCAEMELLWKFLWEKAQ